MSRCILSQPSSRLYRYIHPTNYVAGGRPSSSLFSEMASNAFSFSVISGCRSCHLTTISVAKRIHGPFEAFNACMISAPFMMGFSSHTPSRSSFLMYARKASCSWITASKTCVSRSTFSDLNWIWGLSHLPRSRVLA